MGRRLDRISYGYRGQIDDLARMPAIVSRALPWVHVDRDRIFALGSSMGGQETLLLVARHPKLLAGAAAMDSVTNMARRYGQLRRSASARCSSRTCAPSSAARPPTPARLRGPQPAQPGSQDRRLGRPAPDLVEHEDRIVIDQKHQSGTLFRTLRRLGPCAR